MIDARVLAPAFAAWIAAASALTLPDPRGACAALLVVACASLAIARRHRVLICISALAALLAGLSAMGQTATRRTEPFATWIEQRATVSARIVVVGDAIRREPPEGSWFPARLEARARLVHIEARGQALRMSAAIVLTAPLGTAMPAVGATVDVRGRLGRSPRIDTDATLALGSDAVVIVESPGALDALANAMRAGLRDALAHGPPAGASLVAGLAVGDDSLQSTELEDAMRGSGLAHLTAVSGGNVSILLAVVLGAASLFRFPMMMRVVLALAALSYFVVLVRPQPSVVRAAVMGAVVIVAMLTGGGRRGASVLGLAILVVSIVMPTLAVSWGFALSAFATAGLIIFSPRLATWLAEHRHTRRWPPAVRDALALTLAAQLSTLPLLIAMGSAVGWVSIPANLLAMPAVAPITILGLAAAVISPLLPALAIAPAWVASWPAQWIAIVATWCSALPLARLPWPSGWLGIGALLLVGLAIALSRRVVRHRWPDGMPAGLQVPMVASVITILVLLVLAPPSRRGWPPENWVMVMCDVGQGDASVVRSGDDGVVVIDAGPEPDRIDRCLDDLGSPRIDALVLTHFHADHVDGLAGVVRDRVVRSAFVTTIDDPPEQAADAFAQLATAHIPVTRLSANHTVSLGGLQARVLWPSGPINSGSVPNNASVVLRVDVDGVIVLLTGDIEAQAQSSILAHNSVTADVVKVPHHGSANQDPRLPQATGARIALISVGAGNDYGHPADPTLAAWSGQTLIGRTDLQGDIAVVRIADGGLGLVAHGGSGLHGMLPSSWSLESRSPTAMSRCSWTVPWPPQSAGCASSSRAPSA